MSEGWVHTEFREARVTMGLLDVIGDKSVKVFVSEVVVITDEVTLAEVVVTDVKL